MFDFWNFKSSNMDEIMIAASFAVILFFYERKESRVLWKVIWKLWFAFYLFVRANYMKMNWPMLFYILSVVLLFMAIADVVYVIIEKKKKK